MTGSSGYDETMVGILLVSVFGGILIWYVIDSLLRQVLLRRAGHRTPWSAWIPLWREASLLETAGIRGPWIWTIALVVLNMSGPSDPQDGWALGLLLVISIFALILQVMLTVWTALGVQAGAGVSKGAANGWGVVLLVFLPWIWLIWMIVRLKKTKYNQVEALAAAGTLPLGRTGWWTKGDRFAVFKEPQQVPGVPESGFGIEPRASGMTVSDLAGSKPPRNPYLPAEEPQEPAKVDPPEPGEEQSDEDQKK